MHDCLKPEIIHSVIAKTASEKDAAQLMFHFIFTPGCKECTQHVLKGIELFREKIFQTLRDVSYPDQNGILEPEEERINKFCGQIGVPYPRPNY